MNSRLQNSKAPPSLLSTGPGIGGTSTALALARVSVAADLPERSAEIGEIGVRL